MLLECLCYFGRALKGKPVSSVELQDAASASILSKAIGKAHRAGVVRNALKDQARRRDI